MNCCSSDCFFISTEPVEYSLTAASLTAPYVNGSQDTDISCLLASLRPHPLRNWYVSTSSGMLKLAFDILSK